MGVGDNRRICLLAVRTSTLVGGDYMIKKIASNYIYCGLFTTVFGFTAAALRGEIYTRQILNRIKEKPTEILEPILLWPWLWYKVGEGLCDDKPKKD